MGGGAHRGPVAPTRQRRTIRLTQVLLVLISGALTMFAGYSLALDRGVAQVVVLVILGGIAIGAAGLLSDGPSVRIPTPARLDELAGRAESVALEKAAD